MEERIVGDYRLIKELASAPSQITWLAEQTSVRREVLVEELTDLSQREDFLNDVRVKASVDHPSIGSVYEAISEDGHCLVAMEKLPGKTIAELLERGRTILPVELAHILRMLSEAMLHLASQGIATHPLTPESILFDEQGVLRIGNIARAGTPDPGAADRDITRLGLDLQPLIPTGKPGASRALTVLAWMRGEGIDRSLTWEEIHGYGEQIESQLVEVSHAAPVTPTTRVRNRKSPLLAIIGVMAALAVIAAVVIIMMQGQNGSEPVAKPGLPAPVAIAKGKHFGPDGNRVNLRPFRISACEVTIGEYAEFLETLELLDPESRTIYDAKDQPAEKLGHDPDDWEAMLSAAREGGQWEGRAINLFCPIVNIDWWDATAYCDWKKGLLPTQEEWFAALREKVEKPEVLKPALWGPVTEIGMEDKTINGLYGMAGSVSEWTRDPAVNPANPLGEKRHVIIGGSYLKPENGALAREWTDDRLQRRPDLGFRIVLPAE